MQSFMWKKRVADWGANLAYLTGMTTPGKDSSLALIVTFHRVLPAELKAQYPYPELVVTPDELDWCLQYFKQHYDILTVSDLFKRDLESQTRKPLAITFDDGQADNALYAAPVLNKYGVKGTFYIPVDALEQRTLLWHDQLGFILKQCEQDTGLRARLSMLLNQLGHAFNLSDIAATVEACKQISPAQREELLLEMQKLSQFNAPEWAGMMGWDDASELARQGHEIGSHSLSHTILPQLDDTELMTEIQLSKQFIEERIERPVLSFCYPNGSYDERCERAVAASGYANAVSTRWGAVESTRQRYAFPRCNICIEQQKNASGELSYSMLAFRLSGMHPATWKMR